jgi:hypothetical protein
LSGSIKKGSKDTRDTFWSDSDQDAIRAALSPSTVEFLNPAVREDDVSDALSTYGHDLLQVYCADAVLVDARDRRGIGIGAEMTFAKLHSVPVVALARPNSYYFQDELVYLGQRVAPFIHPFVAGPADFIAWSVVEAAEWVRANVCVRRTVPKDSAVFLDAIRRYVTLHLQRDTPMRTHIDSDHRIREKVELLTGLPLTSADRSK